MHRSVMPALAAGVLAVSLSAQAEPGSFVLRTGGFVNGDAAVPALTRDRIVVRFRGAVDDEAVAQLATAAGV